MSGFVSNTPDASRFPGGTFHVELCLKLASGYSSGRPEEPGFELIFCVLSASVRDFVLQISFGAMNGLRINGELDATEGRRVEPDSPEVGPTQETAETACW